MKTPSTTEPCRIDEDQDLSWRRDTEANRINRLFNSGKSNFPAVFHTKGSKPFKVDASGSLMQSVRSIFSK